MWKAHINDHIWVANHTARNLMSEGLVAPHTGRKENNRNWFQIDPQLVNEIWSVFYPGMTEQAAQRAEWGARITNDDWGTHPTIAYGVMISAAYFEKDVEKLVQMAIDAVPNEGPFAEGIRDVVKWHKKYDDWHDTRREIHNKYYAYKKGDYEAPVSVVSSLCNGLCGIMAILYGEGDYMKTVGIASSAGYDCDNQAATCGALIGVRNGLSGLGKEAIHITTNIASPQVWTEPFNNLYCNFTRDDLPVRTPINEIVDRIAAIAKQAILDNGGKVDFRQKETPSISGKTLTIDSSLSKITAAFGEDGVATVSGGKYGKNWKANYTQDGKWVFIEDDDNVFAGIYDGENLVPGEDGPTAGDVVYVVDCDF
jgi:hypothetical protein